MPRAAQGCADPDDERGRQRARFRGRGGSHSLAEKRFAARCRRVPSTVASPRPANSRGTGSRTIPGRRSNWCRPGRRGCMHAMPAVPMPRASWPRWRSGWANWRLTARI